MSSLLEKSFSGLCCFDQEVVRDLMDLKSDNGECLLIELADLYAKTSESILLSIEKAFEIKDIETIEKQSHMMKSSSGNLGLKEMQYLCSYLEKNADKIVYQEDRAYILNLRRTYTKSLGILKDYVRSQRAA